MQFLNLLPLALAALASAQSTSEVTASGTTSTSVDPAPQTTFLTQTNSDGVVTGMPTQPGAVTTQPAAVTTQPSADLLPAGFTGVTTLIYGNTSYTYSVGSGVTSLIQSTPTPTTQTGASGSGASASASSSGSGTKSSSAAGDHVKAGVGALAAAGGFFALFL